MFSSLRTGPARAAAGLTLTLAGVLMFTGCGGHSASGPASTQDPTIKTNPTTTDSGTPGSSSTGSGSTGSDSAGAPTATSTSTATTTPSRTSSPSGSATASSTHEGATPVTAANLLLPGQIRLYQERAAAASTFQGQGEGPFNMCQTKDWADFGPTAEWNRRFTLKDPHVDVADHGGATIASFASHDAAVAAAQSMSASLNCTAAASKLERIITDTIHVNHAAETLAGGQTAHLTYASFAQDDDTHANTEIQIGVVATGTHVAMVHLQYMTQDSDTQSIITTLNNYLPTLAK